MARLDAVYGKQASILITGASSGIGAELAEQLAGYGGAIALVARREERLAAVADRVKQLGGRPLVLGLDVTDLAAVKRAHAELVRAQGPVTVAFLNAGAGDVVPLHRFDAGRVQRLFEINIAGVANWMELLLPDMISRGQGILAGTSSLAAARGIPGGAAYAASKAALTSLLDGYRAEAMGHGVQISIIEPGFVKSEMTDKNKFPMPFMIETRQAAQVIAEGVADGRAFIRFPWQMSAVMSVLSHLPASIYDLLGAKMLRKPGRKG